MEDLWKKGSLFRNLGSLGESLGRPWGVLGEALQSPHVWVPFLLGPLQDSLSLLIDSKGFGTPVEIIISAPY